MRVIALITESLAETRHFAAWSTGRQAVRRKNIVARRSRPIVEEFPYGYLDGVALKRCCAGEVKNVLGGSLRPGSGAMVTGNPPGRRRGSKKGRTGSLKVFPTAPS